MTANGESSEMAADEPISNDSTEGGPDIESLTVQDTSEDFSKPTDVTNGTSSQQDEVEAEDVEKQDLIAELEQIKGEKEHLESQYRALLGKLTTMRNTLGDKLRQDAVSICISLYVRWSS